MNIILGTIKYNELGDGMKYSIFLSLLLFNLNFVNATTVSYITNGDTYIDQAAPNSNFSSSTSLNATAAAASDEKIIFVRFNVNSLPTGAIINSVKLKIQTTADLKASSTSTFIINPVKGSYTNSSVTWNTKPTLGTSIATFSGFANLSTIYTISLPATSIGSNATYSFAISGKTTADTNKVILYSMESGVYSPTLEIDYSITTTGTAPIAPSNLAISATSSVQKNLSWTDNSNNETIFTLQRATDSACTTATNLCSINANTISYADTVSTSTTTYYYRVRSENQYGASSYTSCTAAPLYTSGSGTTSAWVPRAMWVWRDPVDVINSSTERTNLFNFIAQKNIRVLYVNVRTMIEKHNTASPDTTTETNFRNFLDTAATNGVEVHMLIGDPGGYTYVEPSQAPTFPLATTIASHAAHFMGTLTGAKPTALHFDVEPHAGNPNWSSNKTAYMQRLVDMYSKIQSTVAGSGLKVSADFAHFTDTVTGVYCNSPIGTGTVASTASKCLLNVVDEYVSMSYRDTGTATISLIQNELTEANAMTNYKGARPYIVLGQETIQMTDDPSTTTFDERDLSYYEELTSSSGSSCAAGFTGLRCAEKEFQVIQSTLNANLSYGGYHLQSSYSSTNPNASLFYVPVTNAPVGIAVHHYDKYKTYIGSQTFP